MCTNKDKKKTQISTGCRLNWFCDYGRSWMWKINIFFYCLYIAILFHTFAIKLIAAGNIVFFYEYKLHVSTQHNECNNLIRSWYTINCVSLHHAMTTTDHQWPLYNVNTTNTVKKMYFHSNINLDIINQIISETNSKILKTIWVNTIYWR